MKRLFILLLATSTILCGRTETSLNASQTQVKPTTSKEVFAIKALPSAATNEVPTTDRLSPPATDDITAIKGLFTEKAAALSTGDVSALARFYEPDAIQLPPNSPALTGWEAIRSQLGRELEGIKVAASIEVLEVCTADRWAFARGSYRMVTTPAGGGDAQVTIGNWLDILKRQPDNSWKIARSTWSSEDEGS